MAKRLSEMSLEELWKLFPITLTEHEEQWQEWFEEEKINLYNIFGNERAMRIHHVGSTAIKNIWAKPIIDILIELEPASDIADLKEILIKNGYRLMSERDNRISLNKGYTEAGFSEKVYHVHLRYRGDNDELYFRDYLNDHPMAAKQYEELKISLWKKYMHNRDGYTNAKGLFVDEYTARARKKYRNRY